MKRTFLLATLFVFVAGFAYAANTAAVPAAPTAHAKQDVKKEKKEWPCKAEKEKFCSDVKKGKGRIKECLKKHENELTPACKEKMAKVKKHHNKKSK
jgi:hypothetical protein